MSATTIISELDTAKADEAVSNIEKTFMGFSLEKLFHFLIVFAIAYLVAKIVIIIINKMIRHNKLMDKSIKGFLKQTFKVIVYFVAFTIAAYQCGANVSSDRKSVV